ncbi:MAG: tetratricopeptide repeat protein [Firmicutes bacterium]|nr:tetratricopeptide repeat protein [Bacillota bacterium]
MLDSLTHNPDADDLFKSVLKMEKQKKCDPSEVMDILTQLIEMEPDFAPAYVKRSNYSFKFCEYGLALQDLNKAIELGSNDPEAFYLRSKCYAIIGNKNTEQMEDIKMTLKLDPRHPQANSEMGHYFFEKDYKQDAYKYFTEAINNKTNDPLAFLKRGIINMEQGRYEHAIVDLLDSQKCNPRNTLLYYLRANCYYEIGALDKALKDYELAVFVDPHTPELYYKMGIVYYEKGDLENAVKNFNMMINLQSDSSLGYYSRGIVMLEKNDFAAAAEDFEKAAAIAPNAETCNLLSLAYEGLGNAELSSKYYEQALALGYQPEN